MKIDKLELKDFRCYADLSMNFEKPINLIFGQNAVGKTTIVQAMELALTGKCHNSTLDFRSRLAFVRNGAEGFSVSSTISNGNETLDVLQKSNAKECQPKPEEVMEWLKADRDILNCLLNTWHFLEIRPDDQKRLLFDLLGLKADELNVREEYRKWQKNHPKVLSRFACEENSVEVFLTNLTATTMDGAQEIVLEERKLAKRELKSFDGVTLKDLLSEVSGETLKKQIQEKQKELTTLHTRIGEVRGVVLGQGKRLDQEIAEIASQINRLEQEQSALNVKAEQDTLEKQTKRQEEVKAEIEALREEVLNQRSAISALASQVKAEDEALATFKDFDGTCPFLAQKKIGCQTTEVLQVLANAKHTSKTPELSSQMEKSQEELKRTLARLKDREKALISIGGGLTFHKGILDRFESNRKKLIELRERRENLEKIRATLNQSKIEEAEALQSRVKWLESEIENDKTKLILRQKAEKKRQLEDKLRKLEVLALAFSPKGIMGDLLAAAVSELSEEANRLMAQISGGRNHLEISAEDGFQIFFCDTRTKRKTEISLISESERFRVGIVLQAVLGLLSGLRFIVVDGLDILDQQNRGFFFRFLQLEAQFFDQILAFCTIGRHYPTHPGIRDFDFWMIDNGTVKKLPAAEKAIA